MRKTLLVLFAVTLSACVDIASESMRVDDALVKYQVSEANAAFLPSYSDVQQNYRLSHIKSIPKFDDITETMTLTTASGFIVNVDARDDVSSHWSEGKMVYLIRVPGEGNDEQLGCVVGIRGAVCLPVKSVNLKV